MTRDVEGLVPSAGEFLRYQTEDGRTRVEVRFAGDTVWLPLKQIAELFQRDKSVISRHLKSIFEEGELRPSTARRTRSSTSISMSSSRSATA